MAPGAKFSTMTSARFAMFLTRSSPRSDLRLTVMDFLLALNNRKYQESRFWLWLGPDCRPNRERPASPPCGFSTLTTSAPSQASASVQDGQASNSVRSRTRTPSRKAGNPPFVAIFSSSPQWHRLRQMVDVVDINRCLRHSVKSTSDHIQSARDGRSGWSDVLRTELPGPVPARGRICRQDFARGEAG